MKNKNPLKFKAVLQHEGYVVQTVVDGYTMNAVDANPIDGFVNGKRMANIIAKALNQESRRQQKTKR